MIFATYRYYHLGGGGSDDEAIALALTRNPKLWGLMYSKQITGTSEQLAGYTAALTV